MNDLNQYTSQTADWRKTLRQNTHRTYFVIFLFCLIYLGIGLLIDMFMCVQTYPDVPTDQLFHALITFQIFPIATVVMLVVAGISLFVTYSMYDTLMLLGTEYHEVTPDTARTVEETQLYNVVEEMKIAAALQYMPKVYIIDADYMNAFASGYSEKSAMVAITRGLMQKLNRDELQAVMAHELSHIRHLDIKLTLTASLLANLMIMVLDMFFYNAMFSRRSNDDRKNSFAMIILLLRYLLPVINVFILLYLSRKRELMADAGCVELTRASQPLANALLKINDDYAKNSDRYNANPTPHENVRREAYIFDPTQAGISHLTSVSDMFSTHPSLQERLAALGYKLRQ